MADPKIIIRRSSTPNKVPTENQLALGELAINTHDGKLYLEQDQTSTGLGVTVIVVNPWSVGVGSTAYNTHFTSGNVGLGLTNPTQRLDIDGGLRIRGALYDSNNVVGAAGSILTSTGIGVSWTTPSAGSAGAQGAQGAQGFQGNTGFVGAQGSAGATGAQGSAGATGAQGSAGAQGSTGSTGSQGSPGSGSITVSDTAPVSPNSGDLWYDSTIGRTFLYYNDGDSFQWVDASPAGAGPFTRTEYNYTATSGQTTFNATYVDGTDIDVFLNGVRLSPADYTATSGTNIVLGTSTSGGEIIDILTFQSAGPQGAQGAQGPSGGGGGESYWISTSVGIHTLSNVGVGTTNPSSKLTVSGDVKVTGTVTAAKVFGAYPLTFPTGDYGLLGATQEDAFGISLLGIFDCLKEPSGTLSTIDLEQIIPQYDYGTL
jgi:hypothetical protein